MEQNKSKFQLIWGCLLTFMGIAFLFRIPQIIPQIKQIEFYGPIRYFIYFCLYLIAIILIAQGVKKIFDHYKKLKNRKRN